MINELITFHSQKLNNWNLIFRHIKKELLVIICLCIIVVVCILLGLISNQVWLTIISFTVYLALLWYINRRSKRVWNKNHKLNIKSRDRWNSINSYKAKQINIFLKENNILDKNKIKEYKEFILNEADESKYSKYIVFGVPGLFLALIVPVWNNFNSLYFREGVTIQDGIQYMILVSLVIFMFSFIIGTTSYIVRDICDIRYRKLKELAYLLDLVYLSYEKPLLDDSIKFNL